MITATPGSEIKGADIDANFAECVIKTGNQTIAGVKTFSSVPILTATPTADGEVTHKLYVDKHSVLALGDILMANSDAEVSTAEGDYVLLKQINLGMLSGALRIKFTLRLVGEAPRTATGRIYRNGSGIGTEHTISTNGQTVEYSEDITGWSMGDIVGIYAKTYLGTAYVTNFRIYAAVNLFPRIVI